MTAAFDFNWNHAPEIAPIISAFWRTPGIKPRYQFYGTERAITFLVRGWRAACGQSKPFFAKKRDFVVNTMLGLPEFFCRHSALIFLHNPSIEGGRQWFGTGGYIVRPAREWIESGYDPMTVLIQIDITPIYHTLKPYLQLADT